MTNEERLAEVVTALEHGPRETKGGLRLLDVDPRVANCRKRDLNLHDLFGHQALNLVFRYR